MQETIQQEAVRGANVVIKPPKLFLLSLLIGIILQFSFPLGFQSGVGLFMVGLGLICGSLGLMFWADGTFKRFETAVSPQNPTKQIVTDGPYRFSRNPMYLAFVFIQLGVAVLLASWWLILTLVPAVILLRWGVISREESYLVDQFGEVYLDYKTAVRRWL